LSPACHRERSLVIIAIGAIARMMAKFLDLVARVPEMVA
jgi:hypothetical protein